MHANYKAWPHRIIEPGAEGLPDHIKAITAADLDGVSLAEAEAYFKADKGVEIVNIDINLPPELEQFAYGFREKYDELSTAWGAESKTGPNLAINTPEKIERALRQRFQSWAFYERTTTLENHSELTAWFEAVVKMPRAVAEVWKHGHFGYGSWNGGGVVDPDGVTDFHAHHSYVAISAERGEQEIPGFYLNLTQAQDGTVFKDDETDTLWLSKAWTYNLFSTSGHKGRNGSQHAVPDLSITKGKNYRRYTDIMKIFPTDEEGVALSY